MKQAFAGLGFIVAGGVVIAFWTPFAVACGAVMIACGVVIAVRASVG